MMESQVQIFKWRASKKEGMMASPSIKHEEDRNEHLWFGTNGGGVSRYDGERFETFTYEDGLAGNQVWFILEDRAGHLWFAVRDGASVVTMARLLSITPLEMGWSVTT
tara:strand:- start:166 stop:489 length:324 start_codon:yes stop_codon:yes gene_type:complete